MDQRAIDTLAWLDSIDEEVSAHAGVAFVEREILRMLVSETPPMTDDIVSRAYRMEVERRLLPITNRGSARYYAHLVMFAGNFGCTHIVAPAGTGDAIDQALVGNVDDTDTLGELLIAARIVGHVSPAVTAAQEVFDLAWEQEPRTMQNYHVVLVGGLLYALTG